MIVIQGIVAAYVVLSTLITTFIIYVGVKEKLSLTEIIMLPYELPIELIREMNLGTRRKCLRELRKQREIIDMHLARLGDDE